MAPRYIEVAGDRLEEGASCFVKAEGDPQNKKPFIARIKKLEPDRDNGGYLVTVLWFYRPEDPGIPGGRKAFHGERELYVSDHQDVIHSATILGRCLVHTIEDYQNLELIRPQDYFSRFQFSVRTKKFYPESVTVYCRCQLPSNPDRSMVECDGCHEWFHPECCGTTLEAVEQLPEWRCPDCENKHRAAAAAAAAAPSFGGALPATWHPQAAPSVHQLPAAAPAAVAAAEAAAAAAAAAPPELQQALPALVPVQQQQQQSQQPPPQLQQLPQQQAPPQHQQSAHTLQSLLPVAAKLGANDSLLAALEAQLQQHTQLRHQQPVAYQSGRGQTATYGGW